MCILANLLYITWLQCDWIVYTLAAPCISQSTTNNLFPCFRLGCTVTDFKYYYKLSVFIPTLRIHTVPSTAIRHQHIPRWSMAQQSVQFPKPHITSGPKGSHLLNMVRCQHYLHTRWSQCNMSNCATNTMMYDVIMTFRQQYIHFQDSAMVITCTMEAGWPIIKVATGREITLIDVTFYSYKTISNKFSYYQLTSS